MGPHSCRAVVITCMDFRLQPEIRNFLDQKGLLGQCDIISDAGAAKGIADDETNGLLSRITLAKKLHDVSEVVLINHTDCGAYGGRKAFNNQKEEEEKHFKDLAQAKEKILIEFPSMKIRTYLAYVSEDNSIAIKQVGK